MGHLCSKGFRLPIVSLSPDRKAYLYEQRKSCSVWLETTFTLAKFLRNRRLDGLSAPGRGCRFMTDAVERRGDRFEQLRLGERRQDELGVLADRLGFEHGVGYPAGNERCHLGVGIA